MTEERKQGEAGEQPATKDAAASPSPLHEDHAREGASEGGSDGALGAPPSLLPRGFLMEQARGKLGELDPVEVARAERDDEARRQRRAKQAERNEARQQRQKAEARAQTLDKVSEGFLVGSAVLAPVALGAVHMVALLPLAAMATLGALGAWWYARLRGASFRVGPVGWALLGLAALSFVQALPLPLGLVDALCAPVGAWTREAWGASLGPAPTTASLSLNPGQAARAGVGLLAAAALFLGGYNHFHEQGRFQRALLALPAVGGVLVLVGVLQKAAGVSQRLFFYQPRDVEAAPFFASTFVNPNHLGALLGMVSFLALGLALTHDWKPWRGGLVLLFGACSAGMIMSLSLGSILAWVLGMAALGVLALRRRLTQAAAQQAEAQEGEGAEGRGAPRQTAQALGWASLGVVGALGVGFYAAWSQLVEVAGALTQRQGLAGFAPTQVWRDAWGLAMQAPWLGMGPGSVSDALAISARVGAPVRYDYVGNEWLQLIVDRGFVVAGVVFGVLWFVVGRLGLRRGWKRSDVPTMAAAFGALVFLGFEACVGFSLEIPGVLLPAAFLLALATGRELRYRKPAEADKGAEGGVAGVKRGARAWAPAGVLVGAWVVALPTIPAARDATSGAPGEALREAATKDHATVEEVDLRYRRALHRRPAHGPLHLHAAIGFGRAGDTKQAWEALRRAKLFDKANPAPWIVSARFHLQDDDRAKAFDDYREALWLAEGVEGSGLEAVAAEAVKVSQEDPGELAAVLQTNQRPKVWTAVLGAMRQQGRAKAVLALGERLKPLNDECERVLALEQARAWGSLGGWSEVERLVEPWVAAPTRDPGAFGLWIRAASAQGQPVEALRRAEEGLREHPFDQAVQFESAEVLLEHKEALGFEDKEDEWRRRMERLLQQLKPQILKESGSRHRYYRLAGLYHQQTGKLPSAASDLRKAIEAEPRDPEVAWVLGGVLEEDGKIPEAIEAYKAFLGRFGDDPRALEVRLSLERLEARQRELGKLRGGP